MEDWKDTYAELETPWDVMDKLFIPRYRYYQHIMKQQL